MIPAEICSSVHVLRAQGHTLREIQPPAASGGATRCAGYCVAHRKRRAAKPLSRRGPMRAPRGIAEVFGKARGNAVRARELLAEQGVAIAYSTLTRQVQGEAESAPRKAACRRVWSSTSRRGDAARYITAPW